MALSDKFVEIANSATKVHDEQVLLGDKLDELFPSHSILTAGKHTTLGGDATETVTISGLVSTDIVFAVMQTKGASPVTIVTAAPTANTLTITLSGDPSTDHVIAYVVLRGVT